MRMRAQRETGGGSEVGKSGKSMTGQERGEEGDGVANYESCHVWKRCPDGAWTSMTIMRKRASGVMKTKTRPTALGVCSGARHQSMALIGASESIIDWHPWFCWSL